MKIQQANGKEEGDDDKGKKGRKEEREGDVKCNVMRRLEEVERFSQRVQRKGKLKGEVRKG